MKKITWLFLLLLISTQSHASNQKIYTVGIVPQFDIETLHKIWEPILLVISHKTGLKFKLVGTPDIPTFEKSLSAGKFDFAYMNPYHFTKADQYTAIARDHGRMLYGILTVNKSSDILSPQQLDGKVIAFPAPNALGASLMIRSELDKVYGIKFTPKYVNTHSSSYLNVAIGLLPAGGGVQKTFNQQPNEIKERLKILLKTKTVTPHPLTANKKLDKEVINKFKMAILSMKNNNTTQELLARVPFSIIGAAKDDDYDDVRSLSLEQYYQE